MRARFKSGECAWKSRTRRGADDAIRVKPCAACPGGGNWDAAFKRPGRVQQAGGGRRSHVIFKTGDMADRAVRGGSVIVMILLRMRGGDELRQRENKNGRRLCEPHVQSVYCASRHMSPQRNTARAALVGDVFESREGNKIKESVILSHN